MANRKFLFLIASAVICIFGTATAVPNYYEQNITVSLSGNDTEGCLGGAYPCRTFEYALEGLENSTVVYLDAGAHIFAPTTAMSISDVENVAIVGNGTTVICQVGAGLGFEQASDIIVAGIRWEGCAMDHPSSAFYPKMNVNFPETRSTLFFHRSLNVTIVNCSFSSENGSGISMFDVGGVVTIERVRFLNHSARCSREPCFQISRGLSVEFTYCGQFSNCSEPANASPYNTGATYAIQDCTFVANNNSRRSSQWPALMEKSEYWPYGKGGAMSLVFRGLSSKNKVIVTRSEVSTTSPNAADYREAKSQNAADYGGAMSQNAADYGGAMLQNAADYGGAVSIEFLDETSDNSVQWTGPFVVDGCAAETGGALHVTAGSRSEPKVGGEANAISLTEVTFSNNRASWGGGLTVFNLPLSDGSLLINFYNCSWFLNSATNGADAVGVSHLSATEVSGVSVTFNNCTFGKNDAIVGSVHAPQPQGTSPHCSISTDGIPLVFNNVDVIRSAGPALCSFSGPVHLNGTVRFVDNGFLTRPLRGGAIFLQGSSSIVLGRGTKLVLKNNTAVYYGGGLYLEWGEAGFRPRQRYYQSNCAFGYKDVPFETSDGFVEASVNFDNNHLIDARGAGRDIYLAEAADERCRQLLANITEGAVDVASVGTSVQLHSPAVPTGPNQYTMEVMWGQLVTLNATTRDDYGNVVEMALRVVSVDPRDMQPVAAIGGLTSTVLSDGPVYTDMYLRDSNVSQVYLLLTDTTVTYYSLVNVSFVKRFGFVYDPLQKVYVCFASDRMLCNRTTLEVCIQKDYWYGAVEGDDGKTSVNVVAACQAHRCDHGANRCSETACDGVDSFCRLSSDQDDQCSDNRAGQLCSTCKAGYAFTYDATRCRPLQTCSNGHVAFFAFSIFGFWIAAVFVLLAVSKLNASLGAGCTFSFLYYFSVIQLVLPPEQSSMVLDTIVQLFSSIAQLNPHFLGLINWCAFGSLDGLGYTVLRYIHPLIFLSLLVVVFVLKCTVPRVSELDGKAPFVHINCLILICAFSSLSETSIGLLAPVPLDRRFFVAVQPSVRYLDTSRHLPWALIAMAVEVVFLVPVMACVAVWPLLDRLPCCNSVTLQVRGMMKEYQVCCRRGLRGTAAFYLVARQVAFAIQAACRWQGLSDTYFLQIFCVLVVISHAMLQPYRRRWMNVGDALLLFDLAVVALLNNETGLPTVAAAFFLHLFVVLACLYPAGVLVYLCTAKLARNACRRSGRWCRCWGDDDDPAGPSERLEKSINISSNDGQQRYESLMGHSSGRRDYYHSISTL